MKTEQFLLLAGMIYAAPHIQGRFGLFFGSGCFIFAALIGMGILP